MHLVPLHVPPVPPPVPLRSRGLPPAGVEANRDVDVATYASALVSEDEKGSLWRHRAYELMIKSCELIGHGTSVDVHKVGLGEGGSLF